MVLEDEEFPSSKLPDEEVIEAIAVPIHEKRCSMSGFHVDELFAYLDAHRDF